MQNNIDLEKLAEIISKSAYFYGVMENIDEIDEYEEPCKINTEKYKNYIKATEILTGLKEKGKCTFDAFDIRKPYFLHTVNVTWKSDEFWMIIDKTYRREIAELINLFDEIYIDNDNSAKWQFLSDIYTPVTE